MDPSINNPFGNNFGTSNQGASTPKPPIVSTGQGDIVLSHSPATKKPKKWLWISIVVLAICIVAAIIIAVSGQSSGDPFPLGNIPAEEYQILSEQLTDASFDIQEIYLYIEDGRAGDIDVVDFFSEYTITEIDAFLDGVSSTNNLVNNLNIKGFPSEIIDRANIFITDYENHMPDIVEKLNTLRQLVSSFTDADYQSLSIVINQLDIDAKNLLDIAKDYEVLSCESRDCVTSIDTIESYESKYSENYDSVISIFDAIFDDSDLNNLNNIRLNLSEFTVLVGDRVWFQE